MTAAGRTAAAKAAIDYELEELRFHWGEAYEINYDEHVWHARRRDGRGGLLAGVKPDELYREIRADYALRPVPRGRALSAWHLSTWTVRWSG